MEIKDSALRKKILSVIKISSDQYKDRPYSHEGHGDHAVNTKDSVNNRI